MEWIVKVVDWEGAYDSWDVEERLVSMASSSSALNADKSLVTRFIEECWNGVSLATVPELIARDCRYHDPVFPHMVAGVESMPRHIDGCRRTFLI